MQEQRSNKLRADSSLADLLEAFESDRETAIADLYLLFRGSFEVFAKQWSNDPEVRIDSFQDAVVSLYENLIRGVVKAENSKVKTYLFSIGKNKIWSANQKLRSKVKWEQANQGSSDLAGVEISEDLQSSMAMAFANLGTKCREILTKYYYDRYSIEAIMLSMNYKNENTVKAHKSRCLAQVRQYVLSKMIR